MLRSTWSGMPVVLAMLWFVAGAVCTPGQAAEGASSGPATEDVVAGRWVVKVPFQQAELDLDFLPFGGVLLVTGSFSNGQISFGTGVQNDGRIFWLDNQGILFFGYVGADGRTMQGIVLNFRGLPSLWIGVRLD